MDVLRSFELFIYKRRLPPNRPHPQTAALPQTGTRFLVDQELLDVFSGTWKKNWIKKEGDFTVGGFKDKKKKIRAGCRFVAEGWQLK